MSPVVPGLPHASRASAVTGMLAGRGALARSAAMNFPAGISLLPGWGTILGGELSRGEVIPGGPS
jgi:hypothetical protein